MLCLETLRSNLRQKKDSKAVAELEIAAAPAAGAPTTRPKPVRELAMAPEERATETKLQHREL